MRAAQEPLAPARSRRARSGASPPRPPSGELQPELGRLVDGLEQQLVAVRPLVGPLLERQQLVRAQVALVVARTPRRRRTGVRPRSGSVTRTLVHGAPEHTFRMSDLFSDAAAERMHEVAPLAMRLRPRHARRVRRPAAGARRAVGAAARDRGGPASARRSSTGRRGAARRRSPGSSPAHDRRRLRGALGGLGDGHGRARGARARARAARRRRAADDPLPRRDPPLQQGAAGRAAAGGRGGARDADRRDDREPVLRGQLGAALAASQVYELEPLDEDELRRSSTARRRRARRPRCRTSSSR